MNPSEFMKITKMFGIVGIRTIKIVPEKFNKTIVIKKAKEYEKYLIEKHFGKMTKVESK